MSDHPSDSRANCAATTGWRSGLPRRVHLLGAGGAGLSGAGLLLQAQGHAISGQDLATSDFVEDLRARGVQVRIGPSRASDLPGDAEALVHSAAVPADDEQRLEAERRGLPVLLYAELLARIAPPERTLAVAGTHGKTTTSWMLYHALCGVAAKHSRPAPGALVGGRHRALARGAVAAGEGGWVVLEACEYDRTFLRLSPQAGLITNVEPDHLDVYGSYEAVEEAFAAFASRIDSAGLLVLGDSVPERVEASARCRVWRLGRDFELELEEAERGCARGRLRGPGWLTTLALGVPGEFNAGNAALAVALAVGLEDTLDTERAEAAAREVAHFEGAARRFEPWGSVGSLAVVHDYAHHPTEVRATLGAARAAHPGRPLHVLFQPHQASRTSRFLDDFVDSLASAERVVVADVYGARRHVDAQAAGAADIVARLVARGVEALVGGPVHRAGATLAAGATAGALLLVLGAGDVDTIRDDLFHDLALRFPGAGLPR